MHFYTGWLEEVCHINTFRCACGGGSVVIFSSCFGECSTSAPGNNQQPTLRSHSHSLCCFSVCSWPSISSIHSTTGWNPKQQLVPIVVTARIVSHLCVRFDRLRWRRRRRRRRNKHSRVWTSNLVNKSNATRSFAANIAFAKSVLSCHGHAFHLRALGQRRDYHTMGD